MISTHTPAWGVTVENNSDFIGGNNFNSHARVGRDQYRTDKFLKFVDFNSHARVGRDTSLLIFFLHLLISTHTPAWGVTA